MLAFLFAATVLCQCKPDVLVDDFSKITTGTLPGDAAIKEFNLLGGDYGAAGAPFTITPASKSMTITAQTADIGNPEPQANPGAAATFNYWFTKFDLNACFDLTGYTAISFDLVAPTGSDMNFTMTQKNPTCSTGNTTRLVDSVYKPLSAYFRPDGTKKTVVLPFADYKTNLAGGEFDFVHLKDWTIVNLVPANAVFTMSNLKLVGNCAAPSGTSPVSATVAPTGAPKTNDAARTVGSIASLLVALVF